MGGSLLVATVVLGLELFVNDKWVDDVTTTPVHLHMVGVSLYAFTCRLCRASRDTIRVIGSDQLYYLLYCTY